jgi:acetyl-CoA carboxylase carboxyltransferase component
MASIAPHAAGTPADDDAQIAHDGFALDHVRADLAEVLELHDRVLDQRRADAVARRRSTGRRTARENVADLVDDGTFVEYAPLVVAAQRRRRSLEELIERTPADGLVGGVGEVDGRPVVAMSYDYTVLAGTQGVWNHHKKDRLFELAERRRLPVVFFTEGGGGRPGDTDADAVAALDWLGSGVERRRHVAEVKQV